MVELEVGDGEEAAGRPAGGSKTLAAVEMGRAASWRPGDVELWPGGAERGRRRRERSRRRWEAAQRRCGEGGSGVGDVELWPRGAERQSDGVGRKKRAPNTLSPERPWLYTKDDL